MKNIFKIALTFIVIFTSTFSFHIAPTFFEKRIDGPGGYQEFTMYNNSNKAQRFRVTPLPGTGNYNGHFDKWMEVSPKIITIKPQSSSVLKVYVKAPQGVKEGEYSGFLNFTSVPIPELQKDDGQTTAAAARMGLNVNVEIIGYVGDLKSNLEITNLKVENNKEGKVVVSFKVKNNTPKRGVWYNVDILKANEGYETLEKGKIGVNQTEDVVITLNSLKKNEIRGIRLRDSSTHEDITKKQL